MAQPAIGLNDRLHFLIITKKVLISKLSILIEEGVVKRQVSVHACVHMFCCAFFSTVFSCVLSWVFHRAFFLCVVHRGCAVDTTSVVSWGRAAEWVGSVDNHQQSDFSILFCQYLAIFVNIFVNLFANICPWPSTSKLMLQYFSVNICQLWK